VRIAHKLAQLTRARAQVCNLGSINLERFVTSDGKIAWARLRATARTAVRMLDNVVDLTDFPVERVSSTFRANRRLGVGVMGLADMLFRMRVGYNTARGRAIMSAVMACITEAGIAMSEELAVAKGAFPNWEKSTFFAEGAAPRRNVAISNVPPTGTTSMILDVVGGIEPAFALAYFYKGILDGATTLSYVNKHLKAALEERGLYNDALMREIVERGSLQKVDGVPQELKDIFVTAMDISARDHILAQAAVQRNICNATSKTINFPFEATREDIIEGYVLAWREGCRGTTVYRDRSRVLQVLNLNTADDAPAAVAVADVTRDEDVGEVLVVHERGGALTLLKDEKTRASNGVIDKRRIVDCPDCRAPLYHSEGCVVCVCGFGVCG
jgi:ribonucleoside-diphosphate reductase alpha chain